MVVSTVDSQLLLYVWGQGLRKKLPDEDRAIMWGPRPVSDFESTEAQLSGITSSARNVAAWTNESGGSVYIWMADTSESWNLEPSIKPGQSIKESSCSNTHILALLDDGSVFAWGNNDAGQLGTGDRTPHGRGLQISQIKGASGIVCGEGCSAAVMPDGKLFTWGSGTGYRLGHGQERMETKPRRVAALRDHCVVQVCVGESHMAALTATGEVWCWGTTVNGTSKIPHRVQDLGVVRQIACAGGHTLALCQDGRVYSWGAGGAGQLGHGLAKDSAVPKEVIGLPASPAIKICAGHEHSMVLLEDGTLWSCGSNTYGQLGVGSHTRQSCTAVPVPGFDSVTVHQLCAGSGFGVALVERLCTESSTIDSNALAIACGNTYTQPGLALGDAADKEIVDELCALHDDVSQTKAVVAQVEQQILETEAQEAKLTEEIAQWRDVIAEMTTAAVKARKIEEEEEKLHRIEKERVEEGVGPLRSIANARDDELQQKQQQLGEKQNELVQLKQQLSAAALEQAEKESEKQGLERHIGLLTNAIEEEQQKIATSTAAIDEANDANKQRRNKLREALSDTEQQMLRAPKEERKPFVEKKKLLKEELDALGRGSGTVDMSQETANLRRELEEQLEEEYRMRDEMQHQMVLWQDSLSQAQQDKRELELRKKHLKDLDAAADKGKEEARAELSAAEQQLNELQEEKRLVAEEEQKQKDAENADVSSNYKVLALIDEIFKNASVKHERLLDNYEVSALLERLWARVGKKPLIMQQPESEKRLQGIVQKTMQAFDDNKSMINFQGFLRMISAEPWNDVFSENNVSETLSVEVEDYINMMNRKNAR